MYGTRAFAAFIVETYGNAAIDAKMTGLDGVELDATHGYLLDQFFWPGPNRRRDRYRASKFGSAYGLAARTRKVSGKPTVTVGSTGMAGDHPTNRRFSARSGRYCSGGGNSEFTN